MPKDALTPYQDIRNIPILGNYVRNIDASIGQVGFQEAIKQEISRRGAVVDTVYQDPQTELALSQGSCIVIGNHPSQIDGGILPAALPTRPERDIYIMATSYLYGIGANIDKYLIPVYNVASHETTNAVAAACRRMGIKPPQLPQEEADRRNGQSTIEAIKKVRAGGLLTVFPEGSGSVDGKWHDGIALILKKCPEAQLIMAYIHGTHPLDVLRIVPGVDRVKPFKATVALSRPYSVSDLLSSSPSGRREMLTKTLQGEYNQWKDSLRLEDTQS